MGNTELGKEQEINMTVEDALGDLSLKTLERNNWPILTTAPKHDFQNYNEDKNILDFWKQIFNKKNYINLFNRPFDPSQETLFILHPFGRSELNENSFVAVTTRPDDFIKDPENMINYNLHGRPCSVRSSGNYPNIKFEDFLTRLTIEERSMFEIPDKEFRENFYKNL
jgi:hypothetical protein